MNLAVPIADFNIHSLSLVQRILVTTDGTLTETLAAIFLEPIELVKLAVTITQSPQPVPPLELEGGADVMQRQIVLRGSRSRTPYVYAEVLIATDRLPSRLRDELLEGRVPLGALWILHRLEIYKDRPRVRQRPAGDVARHLNVSEEDILIERAYRTFTSGRPVFLVSEYFPAEYRPSANDGA
jgi:chorismate-pyruvate lyase